MYGSQWLTLVAACSLYKAVFFYYRSHKNPYHTSHVDCIWTCEGSYGLNHYHHNTKLHRKQYHSLVAVGIVTHAGHSYNTDGNKLAIFSSIPLYYGDTVITSNISYVTREGDYIADNWIGQLHVSIGILMKFVISVMSCLGSLVALRNVLAYMGKSRCHSTTIQYALFKRV